MASSEPSVVTQILGQGFQWQYGGIEAETPECQSDNVTAACNWSVDADRLLCTLSVANSGSVPVPVSQIRLKFRLITAVQLDKVFFHSWSMNGQTGLREAAAECRSSGVMGWSNRQGTAAVLAGFLDHSAANMCFDAVRIDERTWQVTATVSREGVSLAPGARLVLSPLQVQIGAGLFALLEQYAGAVAAAMGGRPQKPAESGWCSWYHFYGKETFKEVASCAEELADSPLASSLRTIQIDDGWNREASGNFPDAWGDWEAHPDKFPAGMAAAARQIHGLGFRAGLWLAPLAVAKKSRFFVEHPEWLVQQRDPDTGNLKPVPTGNPDIFQLDCTHPSALEWLKETFRRVFNEWGFDYIKIDFLHYGAIEGGIRHDPSATSIEAYRRGLQAINDVAGADKFILGCGAPLLASIGLVDGMRIGPDVGARWLFDPGWPDWPVGNCSIRAAAITSLWSQWMHNRWWQNDPDCLLVRDTAPRYEHDFFSRLEKDVAVKTPNYLATPLGLNMDEAGLWTRLIWMSGGMTLLSEVWSELPADRRELLTECFKAHERSVSVLNWFELDNTSILIADGKPFLAGLFNFGDVSCCPEIPAEKLGLSGRWSLRERWSGEVLQGEGAVVKFPEMPPHSGRVWENVR